MCHVNVRVTADRGPWMDEAIEVVRGASGGLLFGIPLLYTNEVWDAGSHTDPAHVLGVLAFTFVPVLLLNRTGGFRRHRAVRTRDALVDTVETVALGIVLVTVLLVVVQEIDSGTSMRVAVGKVAYEALPFCLGIGVAQHFLRRGRDEGDDDEPSPGRTEPNEFNATLADLGATAIGAVFIGLSIAPTDEVPTVAAAMGPRWFLVTIAVSLAVSYAIVFVAGFVGERQRRSQVGVFQRPSSETVACYLLSLAVSALMLLIFQRADGPPSVTLGHVVVLGLPAVVGGAAGRLAI